ncbi:MAG: FkbM family methyltransferase [bacterium]|nr:FkbM family methyltransferase [bacterium]
MGFKKAIKQLHLIQRNSLWWNTPLSVTEKLTYYGFIFSSVIRAAFTKKKKIVYLGNVLHYENIATPLSLQAYPHEVYKSILANTRGIRIKRVLDIGGNIGQFSLTINHALKDKVLIDVLEPNSEIFHLLRENTAHKKNIRIFNLGVGKSSLKHMYFNPGKSATGSIFKRNSTTKSAAKKTKIELVNEVAKVTGNLKYDLVKIDVEGYEYSLLESIKPFATKLMFLEVSGLGRSKNFTHSDLFSLIESKFGKFDILHISDTHAKSNNFDILIRFR